eukprot:scaffold26810_cov142-Skeletonema_marinoi.AAC.14
MPEFDDGEEEEYYGRPDNNLQRSSHRNKLSPLEESSPLMPDEDDMQFSEEEEEQYSGQNSEPEWKAAQRQGQMRQSNQFRQSQQMRRSNQFRQSQQSQQMRNNSQQMRHSQKSQLSHSQQSQQMRNSQLSQSQQMRNSQQMRQSQQSQQLRNSQLSAGGNWLNGKESFVSQNQQQSDYPIQRRDFNPNRSQSIRQSNTSSHRSSQSHRNSQFNQREDEISEMTGTVEDSARARRGSENDMSTLDTVTLRSIGHAEARRLSDNSPVYHLPAAPGIDLCAANDDPLNAIPLDTTSIGQDPSKRKRKIKMWCGLIVLILLLGAIAVAVLFVTGVISIDVSRQKQPTIPVQNSTSDGASNPTNTIALEEIGSITSQPTTSSHPSFAPSPAPSYRQVIDVLDISPADLEGKCSPSNFPYTIEICRESCIAAECCYLNEENTVTGCFDTSLDTYNGRLNSHRCKQYRPHCDVFYDKWIGGEDGYIRPPPDNLNQLCRKRLNLDSLRSRALDFEDDVCLKACLPSKCCQAMKVAGESDTESIISYLGYVMTSCERRNGEECRAYNATCFGIFDEPPPPEPVPSPSISPSIGSSSSPSESVFESLSPTLVPTRLPTSIPSIQTEEPSIGPTVSVTTEPSISPSFGPSISETTQPTRIPIVPIANLSEINNACTSPTSKNLIVGGNIAAKVECLTACEPGLCCYAEILRNAGLTDIAGNPANIRSCFDSNRDICGGYSGCLTLTLGNSGQSSLVVPEIPTQDLSFLCSVESRAIPTGVLNCFEECRKGSCCTALPPESCFDKYQDVCGQYAPCQAMLDAYGGDASGLPPTPPANLDLLCSYDYLLANNNECERACASIGCCLQDECPDIQTDGQVPPEDTPLGRCALYYPCQNLYVKDKMQACLGGDSSKGFECLSACDVASCCFPQSGEESCFALFEDLCLLFAPVCAPQLVSEGSAGNEVPPPPANLLTLCLTGYGDDKACMDACAPSSCCFTTLQSCFAENEDVCAEWEICAAKIQYQEEQEEGFEE